MKWGENTWTLVGIFDDGGAVSESEIWCDVKVLQPAYRRGNSYQSVYAWLASPDSFEQLKDCADDEPAAERDGRCARQSTTAARPQTLQSDHPDDRRHHRGADGHRRGVRRRHHDVHRGRHPHARDRDAARARLQQRSGGDLGARGGGARSRMVGGLIGGLIAWLAFNGYETATMNFQSFSQIAFEFAVTGAAARQGAVLRGGRWGSSAVCCPRFAPRGCRSLRRCESSKNDRTNTQQTPTAATYRFICCGRGQLIPDTLPYRFQSTPYLSAF